MLCQPFENIKIEVWKNIYSGIEDFKRSHDEIYVESKNEVSEDANTSQVLLIYFQLEKLEQDINCCRLPARESPHLPKASIRLLGFYQ